MAFLFTSIYLIGFFLTLTFLKFFGKKLGLDYTRDKDETYWPDDYRDNAEAYMTFSTFWPIIVPLGMIAIVGILAMKFARWYIK